MFHELATARETFAEKPHDLRARVETDLEFDVLFDQRNESQATRVNNVLDHPPDYSTVA